MSQNFIEQIKESIARIVYPGIFERRDYFERLANTDALTGLSNRAAFDLAEAAATGDKNLHFIIFDANNFKKVNKVFSHADGDQILKKFAAAIADVSRKYKCRAFRLGGDEFVIICHKNFARAVRDKVELLARPVIFDDFTVSLSGTIGATLAEADSALQKRKTERKTRDFYVRYNQTKTQKENFAYAG